MGDTRQVRAAHVRLPTMLIGYSTKFIRASLAVLLSLWIAGAGCMFGCEAMAAAAASESTSAEPAGHHSTMIVSGEACATSGSSHDCCARKKAGAQKTEAPTASTKRSLQTETQISTNNSLKQLPSSGIRECPLAVGRAVALAKSQGADRQTSAQALPATEFTFNITSEQHTSVTPVARLPNRGHTYLRCCVFLI